MGSAILTSASGFLPSCDGDGVENPMTSVAVRIPGRSRFRFNITGLRPRIAESRWRHSAIDSLRRADGRDGAVAATGLARHALE
jgi:hypothetical protein